MICVNHLKTCAKDILASLQKTKFSLKEMTVAELGNILAFMILRNDPKRAFRKIRGRENVTEDENN